VIAAGQRIAKLSGEDVLGEAQRILASCQPRTAAVIRSIGEFMRDSTVVMQARCDATDVITGVATSLDWLDENVSGWQRGDLIVVAARPSVGKTAFALQCAIHAANAGHPVFFASLEQSGTQIAERATAHISSVSLQHITQPKRMTDAEWDSLAIASKKLDAMPISIDESGALTAEAICARVRQVNAQRRLGLVVIDYLQQITPPRADKVADGIQTNHARAQGAGEGAIAADHPSVAVEPRRRRQAGAEKSAGFRRDRAGRRYRHFPASPLTSIAAS
jgi:replicative DNA helicase